MFNRLISIIEWLIFLVFCAVILTYSTPQPTDEIERVRAYTRDVEFNYIGWVTNASFIKLQQASAGVPYDLGRVERKQVVTEHLDVIKRLLEYEYVLEQIYADPNIKDKQQASRTLRMGLEKVQARQNELAPLAEAILQEQVSQMLVELQIAETGQPIPPVSFHSSPLPNALIVSPRDHIEQIANISILPDLTVEQKNALERQVDKGLDVSSLVESVGGIGVYPTMIMRTYNLSWILTTISHEWTHNFLSLRPLGLLYDQSPELRTMNETVASIVGNEVGRRTLERFYPELAVASLPDLDLVTLVHAPAVPEPFPHSDFDFRVEMHATRVYTDKLLAEGKIEEAEIYMEARRQIFWQNGYQIRKLNQAYFAFHGAYADIPGGAAGEDPVGPAVRALREQSTSLAGFLNAISWMTSFEQLQQAVR
jgi:hypothetical protein